ncbi:hypothetical protein POVCU2_0074230, partial [Plasmodium ovale curtisi]
LLRSENRRPLLLDVLTQTCLRDFHFEDFLAEKRADRNDKSLFERGIYEKEAGFASSNCCRSRDVEELLKVQEYVKRDVISTENGIDEDKNFLGHPAIRVNYAIRAAAGRLGLSSSSTVSHKRKGEMHIASWGLYMGPSFTTDVIMSQIRWKSIGRRGCCPN